MAYTIPNAGAATYPEQTELHQSDVDILLNAFNKCGVLATGVNDCAVTPQSALNVSVAAGFAVVQGTTVKVAAGNLAITVDPTDKRYSYVVVDATGAKSVITGTAGPNPTKPAVPGNLAVLAEIFTPGGAAAIVAGMIVDKRVVLNSPQALESVSRADIIGHSFCAETGSTQLSFGTMHRLAQAYPLKFRNLARAAACVVVPGNLGDAFAIVGNAQAGWGWIYDQVKNNERTTGLNTTVGVGGTAANLAAGTSVLVGSSAGFTAHQPVLVGRGASAEINYVASAPDGTHVTFDQVLANAHLAGEPVVACPDTWQMPRQLVVWEYDWNDLAWMGPTTYAVAFPHAARAVFARLRECCHWEADSVLVRQTSGAWSLQSPGAGYASAGKYLRPGAAGAQLTLDVAPLPAGAIGVPLSFRTDANGDGCLYTISVNGGAGITHDTRNINGFAYLNGTGTRAANGKEMASTKIIRIADGLVAGVTNTITITATTLQGLGGGFDGFGVIPPDPPPIVVMRPGRMYAYNIFVGGSLYVPSDADLSTMDNIIMNLIAEFTPSDPFFFTLNRDTILNKNRALFCSDMCHNNDAGHGELGLGLAQLLNAAALPLRNLMMCAPIDQRGWYAVYPAGTTGAPAFFNTGWANAGALPTYTPGGYYKDITTGRVDLRGEIINNTLPGVLNGVIFTLPPGHRPLQQQHFTVQTVGGPQTIFVEANGDVKIGGIQEVSTSGGVGWISLSGVSFYAEQ